MLAAIHARRSTGHLRTDPIAPETIVEVLRAAQAAPNHHLTAPWRFIVLAGAARRALGEAHAAAMSRADADMSSAAYEREVARPERAPVVIVVVCAVDATDAITAREDRDGAAAATQNALLAAESLGLGAIWRTGPMVDERNVRDHLGVESDEAIVALVYVGVPESRPATRSRPEPTVEWRGFDTPS